MADFLTENPGENDFPSEEVSRKPVDESEAELEEARGNHPLMAAPEQVAEQKQPTLASDSTSAEVTLPDSTTSPPAPKSAPRSLTPSARWEFRVSLLVCVPFSALVTMLSQIHLQLRLLYPLLLCQNLA